MSMKSKNVNEVVNLNEATIKPASEEGVLNKAIECKKTALNKAIQGAALLDAIEYEMNRKDLAKSHEISVKALDRFVDKARDELFQQADEYSNSMFEPVNAWFEEVELTEVLDDIHRHVCLHTVVKPEEAIAITLWIAFSWVHEYATTSPILYLTSPMKRCGKSTLLDVITRFAEKPLPTGNITPAATFRSIDEWTPMLVIDEADTFFANHGELKGIVNCSHKKAAAYIIRCDGEDNAPKRFATWCPKLIAGIGQVADTVMDRSIVIQMMRKKPEDEIQIIRHQDEAAFSEIKQKLKRWRTDSQHSFQLVKPAKVQGLNDRANENWEPLLALAELASPDWVEKAINASKTLSGSDEDEPTLQEQIIIDALDVFESRSVDRIKSSDLVDALSEDENKPWQTYSNGRSIMPRQLSLLLKPFGIKPKDLRVLPGSPTAKGYYRQDFKDIVERYGIDIGET